MVSSEGDVAGSFRDPSGFVFRRAGVLYRQVNAVHAADYNHLMTSGLYDDLTRSGSLVAHEETSVEAEVPSKAHKVLRPEVVDFVSYPYEWCFGQLKDAALVTLDIQRRALDAGMSLRDASAYNIQFHRGRPLLIDTLSFEKLRPGTPWIAYRQFCQHFLAPLALMSYTDVRAGDLARIYLDGVPLDLATRLLPARARFRIPLLLHLFLHARGEKRYAGRSDQAGASGGRAGFTLQAFKGLIDSLSGGIEKMTAHEQRSTWVDYYGEADHYGPDSMGAKKDLVSSLIAEIDPALVWDLGANTGDFSRLASARGIKTIAFEADRACVEENYRRVKANGEKSLLPLVLDLTNPSPAIGWDNRERMTLRDRGPVDLVMALALLHHLAIANNVPLARVAELLSGLGRRLIIEFVPKTDEMVQRLLATREDIFGDYTRAVFEKEFERLFEIERVEEIAGSERVLYLMRAR